MKIKELELQNFHGFESRHITLSDHFTVLIGNNGTGKTAILDGLAIALGSFLSGFKGVNSRHIRKDEIHQKQFFLSGKLDIQEQYPVSVKAVGELDNIAFSWAREINGEGGSTTSKNAKEIIDYAASIQSKIRNGKEVILPVISYYGTQRLWIQKDERASKLKHNRLEGYEHCLEPASNIKHFINWIEHMTYIQLQEGEGLPILPAVTNAISQCMEEWESIEYSVRLNELIVRKDNGETLPFNFLSDGYRSVIGLVADLAHRMAMLNPFLGKDVCQITPGVVLIDELDLHLHPKWQRKIVEDLKRVFPKVQFITTTHSPFIIQSLEPDELRKLNLLDDDEKVPSGEFFRKSIEDISEVVMDIDNVQRSEKLNQMYKVAQEYYQLINQGVAEDDSNLKDLKNKLDELESLYSDDVAFYAFLKMERAASGLGD
ncbi:MAG: AAA family ATPase [Lysinibacillus sp.]